MHRAVVLTHPQQSHRTSPPHSASTSYMPPHTYPAEVRLILQPSPFPSRATTSFTHQVSQQSFRSLTRTPAELTLLVNSLAPSCLSRIIRGHRVAFVFQSRVARMSLFSPMPSITLLSRFGTSSPFDIHPTAAFDVPATISLAVIIPVFEFLGASS